MLPKRHAGYRSENALLREMVGAFVPPSWATLVTQNRHLVVPEPAIRLLCELLSASPSHCAPPDW